ncbi:uncharacterized protein LOC114046046 [Vombatus ursinus]|uniref:uncharacterized protein LOC114046046 n=1 Tax=Vombatus ursinus TaxID=29139 RepID=UPI000FFCF3B2|nr:uncharacterized protein LOC114046046 [Vombatus ursinus]
MATGPRRLLSSQGARASRASLVLRPRGGSEGSSANEPEQAPGTSALTNKQPRSRGGRLPGSRRGRARPALYREAEAAWGSPRLANEPLAVYLAQRREMERPRNCSCTRGERRARHVRACCGLKAPRQPSSAEIAISLWCSGVMATDMEGKSRSSDLLKSKRFSGQGNIMVLNINIAIMIVGTLVIIIIMVVSTLAAITTVISAVVFTIIFSSLGCRWECGAHKGVFYFFELSLDNLDWETKLEEFFIGTILMCTAFGVT